MKWLPLLAISLLLAGCSTTPPIPNNTAEEDADFLRQHPNITWGRQTGAYETGGRSLTRLTKDHSQTAPMIPPLNQD